MADQGYPSYLTVGADGSISANFTGDIHARSFIADIPIADQYLAGLGVAKLIGLIVGNQIAAHTITANNITAATITGAEIAARTITAALIATGTITANEIATNTITANKLSVSQLSAITADMGSITAGTITGGAIRTSAADPVTRMDSTGLFVTDASGNKVTQLIPSSGAVDILGGTTASPPNERRVRWRRLSDGAVIGSITAYDAASNDSVLIDAQAQTANPNDSSDVYLRALDDQSTVRAQVDVHQDNRGVGSLINIGAGAYGTQTLLTGAGVSKFLQLLTAQKLLLNVGSGTITWGGGNPLSQALTVTHSLGVVPTVILCWAVNLAGGIVINTGRAVTAPTTTQFVLNGRTADGSSPANGTTTTVYWAVLG